MNYIKVINITFDQIMGVPVKLFCYLSNRSRKTPAQVVFRDAFQIQKRSFLYLQILENKFSYITLETTVFAFLCRSQEEQFLFPKIGADFLFFVARWFD